MRQNSDVSKPELELIAAKSFAADDSLAEVADFLNMSLKTQGYVFGVSKSGDKMTMVIYQVDEELCQ